VTALTPTPPHGFVSLHPTPPLSTLGPLGGSSGGDDAADADCGCSGGLSRELPAALGSRTGSSASSGGIVAAEPAAAVVDAAGDGSCGSGAEPSESAAEETEGDMVYVEEGEFRFGTDKPFIIPVRTAVPRATRRQSLNEEGSFFRKNSKRCRNRPSAVYGIFQTDYQQCVYYKWAHCRNSPLGTVIPRAKR